MNIVEIASEAVPFAKTGGLGDVLGALPKSLAKKNHQVVQFLPFYDSVQDAKIKFKPFTPAGEITVGDKKYKLKYTSLKDRKLSHTLYFIANDELFGREALYVDPLTKKDYKDNDDRFIFFNLAVFEILKKINFKPDVMHAHDWQAALMPSYLKNKYKSDPFFAGAKSVLTIHNMAFHGQFEKESYPKIGLDEKLMYAGQPFEFFEKVNFLKAGICFADKITTVSPTYAEEIQASEETGAGLDGVLRERTKDVHGILNGVDYKIWSPSIDKLIEFNYYHANLTGKRESKVSFLNECGLPIRDDAPLIGIISRLTDQKGFDLIEEVADDIFKLNIQMVVLGTGDEKYHKMFEELEEKYPDKVKTFLKYDDTVAHKIEAASDIFLMPSKFEPCGLNQMYSLKYGTLPLVRKVGGLADTVVNYSDKNPNGYGFVFEKGDSAELLATIKRAVDLFAKKRVWKGIMIKAMKLDYSWKKAAAKYIELFSSINGRD